MKDEIYLNVIINLIIRSIYGIICYVEYSSNILKGGNIRGYGLYL